MYISGRNRGGGYTTMRRCGNCSESRYNIYICKKNEEISNVYSSKWFQLITVVHNHLAQSITSHSQSPRALFQTLQPPNSIIPPQHKKIYRFLYRSFLQRFLQPLNKFVHCAQPCCTSYNATNPTDRPMRYPLRPTFYLAVVVQLSSTQLNPVYFV